MKEQGIAIVTGASRGIGLAITKKMIEAGYTVIGSCRNSNACDYKHERFILESVNLTNFVAMKAWIDKLKAYENIKILVNNAGIGLFSPLEEFQSEQIQEMTSLNLTVPMLLTNGLLRNIKENKGRIIFIASVSGIQISPWGAVYGATKAGLIHFGRQLFQELRKSNVKVTTLIPDLTATEFYSKLNFETDEDPRSHLLASCIADALMNVIQQREGTVISEMVIQPEIFKIKKKNRRD
jgi:short-subunit dehydrogenase